MVCLPSNLLMLSKIQILIDMNLKKTLQAKIEDALEKLTLKMAFYSTLLTFLTILTEIHTCKRLNAIMVSVVVSHFMHRTHHGRLLKKF